MTTPTPPPVFYFTVKSISAPELAATFTEMHGKPPEVCYTTTEHGQRVTVAGPIPPAAPSAPEGVPAN